MRRRSCRGVCAKRLTNGFGAWHKRRYNAAFTILELLIVIAIIIILAGLILATSGYVQKKGARSRTEAEIAAISAALENYKADNGIYPRDPTRTQYSMHALTLTILTRDFEQSICIRFGLSISVQTTDVGDLDGNLQPDSMATRLTFRSSQTCSAPTTPSAIRRQLHIRDPFGNSYGYSTAYSGQHQRTDTIRLSISGVRWRLQQHESARPIAVDQELVGRDRRSR